MQGVDKAPWQQYDKTLIVMGTNFCKEKQKESKTILDLVLLQLGRPVTLQKFLDGSGITKDQYGNEVYWIKKVHRLYNIISSKVLSLTSPNFLQ